MKPNPTEKEVAVWRRVPSREVSLVWKPYDASSERTLHRTTIVGGEAFT